MLEHQARRRLACGDAAGAIETLREVLAEHPEEPEPHALLAIALLAARRRHAARVEAEEAIGLGPELPDAHLALGYVRSAFRELPGAREAFQRAAALAPESDAPRLGLGRVEAAAGRRAEARAAFERALELEPGDPDALVELGELDLAEGRREGARERALAALSRLPEHEGALALMGNVLLAEGRTEEAREHALMVLREDPGSLRGLHLLCAAKARRSLLLGLWWRWNAFMSSLGDRRSILILVGLFVAQRLAVTGLRDAGLAAAASAVSYAWLAFAVYTWVGPGVFARSLRNELRSVRLRPDY